MMLYLTFIFIGFHGIVFNDFSHHHYFLLHPSSQTHDPFANLIKACAHFLKFPRSNCFLHKTQSLINWLIKLEVQNLLQAEITECPEKKLLLKMLTHL